MATPTLSDIYMPTNFESTIYFTNNPLDRRSECRDNKKEILEFMHSERALYVVFRGLDPLVREVANENRTVSQQRTRYKLEERFVIHSFTLSELREFSLDIGDDLSNPLVIYIGSGNGLQGGSEENDDDIRVRSTNYSCGETANSFHWFAVDLSGTNIDEEILNRFPESIFQRPRPGMLMLKKSDAAIAGQARSMLAWHERYSFCPTCGKETKVEEAGYKRSCVSDMCPSNNGVHNTCFPRTDPAVIMLVISADGERVVLGRKKAFYKNVYSCLAGFVEPGETIEEAVKREVKEESGIVVGKVQYKFSQPWPFPSVLMIGCFAEALSEEITVCTKELEDVRWFDKHSLLKALAGTGGPKDIELMVPPAQTIANHLMWNWIEEKVTSGKLSKM